jgi:hypothetical protein
VGQAATRIGEKQRRFGRSREQEQQATIEKTLRRMGECSLQMKNFSSASDFFDQAKAALPAGSADPDLDKDVSSAFITLSLGRTK